MIKSNMMTLGKEINEINRNNGWNVTVPSDWNDSYKIPAILALIQTEITEAEEALEKNDFDNFKEELSDIVIRILDFSSGMDFDIGALYAKAFPDNIVPEFVYSELRCYSGGIKEKEQREEIFSDYMLILTILARMYRYVSHALEDFRKDSSLGCFMNLNNVFGCIDILCDYLWIDMDYEVDKKLEKNKKRAHKHGGKRI